MAMYPEKLPLYEEEAWQIYCKETAGGANVVDFWHELKPDVQFLYVGKVFERFCYDKRNFDRHWRLKGFDDKVYDFWPSSHKWRRATDQRAEIDVGRLYEALTGKDPWVDVEVPVPRVICEDCGAMAFGDDELLHHVSCTPGESKYWEQFYLRAGEDGDEEGDE